MRNLGHMGLVARSFCFPFCFPNPECECPHLAFFARACPERSRRGCAAILSVPTVSCRPDCVALNQAHHLHLSAVPAVGDGFASLSKSGELKAGQRFRSEPCGLASPSRRRSSSRPSQRTRRTGHPSVLVMPTRSRARATRPASPFPSVSFPTNLPIFSIQ